MFRRVNLVFFIHKIYKDIHNPLLSNHFSNSLIFKGEEHLRRTIFASLKIRDKTKEETGIRIAIGLNSGEMIFGNIRFRSLKRLDSTVIGNVVNTAARYQEIAEADEV